MVWVYHYDVPRDAYTIQCEAWGQKMNRVKCTEAELEEFNCGRNWECCARAFVCESCKRRIAFKAPAPDID